MIQVIYINLGIQINTPTETVKGQNMYKHKVFYKEKKENSNPEQIDTENRPMKIF